MGVVRKILYIFNRKQKIRLIELFILILIGTALETVGIAAIIPFVNSIMYPEKIVKNKYAAYVYEMFHLDNPMQFVILLAIMLIIVYILKNAFLIFMNDAQYRFIYNNQKRMAHRLLSCYLEQPYVFHLHHNSAELINNISSDVDIFFTTMLQCILVTTDASICVAIVVILLIVDKTITISVAIMLGLFIVLFAQKYKKSLRKMGEDRRKYAIKNTKCIQQAFGGIKEIKILNREQYFSDVYEEQYNKYAEARRKAATYSTLPKPIMETVSIIALMAVVAFKISRGVAMEYFIPTMSVFALAVIRILPSCSKIAANMSAIMFGKSSIDALYNDLKSIEPYERVTKDKENIGDKMEFEKEIKLEELSFRYSDTNKWILDNINMVIPKNKSIAFIGPSGAGKTTLADIMLGILEYEKGNLYIDKVNVKKNLQGWQARMGYIPQSIFLTDDTIRRNIAFAVSDKEIDDKKVWDAIEKAQLKEFIEGLPEGIDTEIGERGVRLSGGQRQRIGIARALYNDPEVLVLDEATSALDNDTEKAVMEAINALSGKKTLIIIAHRLSTIENCDIVFEVKDGQVKEKEK